MADMYILGQTTSKSRLGNGVRVPVQGLRDGTIPVVDWVAACAIEGKVFQANHGTVTTPITFIAYDADRPDFALDVPSGYAAFITKIQVYLEDAAGTDTEIIATTSDNLCGASTSTALTEVSSRRNGGVSSGCSAYGTYTANCTLPTNTLEFWRAGFPIAQAAGVAANFEWKFSDGNPQLLIGTSSLQIHVSATTTQAAGYIKVSWVELQASEI